MTTATRDEALVDRIWACVVQESYDNPVLAATDYATRVRASPSVSMELVWPVAIATEDAYAYALEADNPDPGGDPTVITDAAILSAVQANWPGGPDVPSQPMEAS